MEGNNIDKKQKEKNIKIALYVIAVISVLLIVVGVTLAFFSADFSGEKITTVSAGGGLTFRYNEVSEGIVSVTEMSTEDGMEQDSYFDFDVVLESTEEKSLNYMIFLTDVSGNLDKNYIKLYLTDQEDVKVLDPVTLGSLEDYDDGKSLYKNSISGTGITTHHYRLRAWVDEELYGSATPDTNISNITDGTNIKVESQTYQFRVNVKVTDEEFPTLLSDAILYQGVVTTGDGLYVSNETNDGSPTYYYHGNTQDNYVSFANLTWRVIRINEDGTIKMILDDKLSSDAYFNQNNYNQYIYMYYSNSDVNGGIKKTVDDWYTTTLEEDYDSYIAITNFCEAAKVKNDSSYTSGNATMEVASNYTADFKCEKDGNDKQYVSEKAGLIIVDEVVMTGIPLNTGSQTNNTNTYLQKSYTWWTMSPTGFSGTNAYVWRVYYNGSASVNGVRASYSVRPVISLNADTLVTGSGASGDMWIVQ